MNVCYVCMWYMYVCINYVCMCVCMCMYVHMYVRVCIMYMYVYVYIFMSIHIIVTLATEDTVINPEHIEQIKRLIKYRQKQATINYY